MAIMIPDVIRESTRSRGERQLFNRLRREIPDDCYVLHSLGISDHPTKLWAESDFVLIAPHGIYVLEIKGGGISCEKGVWTYTDRHGTITRKPEGPFEQAKSAMYAIKKRIEKDQGNRGFLYGYGVITPDENFEVEGPEIESGVLLCKHDWDRSLYKFAERLHKFWAERYQKSYSRESRTINVGERDIIRKILRPETRSAYTLGSRLNNIDQQMIELTYEQLRSVRGMENNPRTIIQGGAGTGKTILAYDRAISLARKRQKVLLLCFNRLLADNFIENLPPELVNQGMIWADSIHRYFRSVVQNAGKLHEIENLNVSDNELYTKIYPEVYIEVMLTGDKSIYDAVVVDETQDLMTHEYLDAIDLTLKDGLNKGSWHLFLDPNQNIYGTDSQGPMRRLQDIGFASFNLSLNCRNTMTVAVTTSIISSIPMPLAGALDGGDRKIIFFRDHDDFLLKLEKEITNLVRSGLSLRDFIVLSTRSRERSSVADIETLASYPLQDITKGGKNEKALDFCTMHSFKGLERKAVVAIDLTGLGYGETSVLLYAGLSRARSYLSVFIDEADKEAFERNSREFGTWLAGTNLVERSEMLQFS